MGRSTSRPAEASFIEIRALDEGWLMINIQGRFHRRRLWTASGLVLLLGAALAAPQDLVQLIAAGKP